MFFLFIRKRLLFSAVASAALVFLLEFGVSAQAMLNVKVGETYPPFSLPDTKGGLVTSASLAKHPSTVIFWSTWSPRSREILEDFISYHEEYSKNGLRIVAINIDGENLSASRKKAILDYADELKPPFPVLLDEDLKAFSDYGVVAHPSTLVIDAAGKITYMLSGYPTTRRDELKSSIQKVLGLWVEPPQEVISVGYKPKGGSLQYFNMGKKMLKLGNLEKALGYFEQSRERDPEFIEPAIMAARVGLMLDEEDQAEAIIKGMDAGYINRDDVRYILGYISLVRGNTSEAEAAFENIREKSPGSGWGLWGLGLVSLSRGELDAAALHMQQASLVMPGNYEASDYVRRYFSRMWMLGQSVPEEDLFIEVFPSLAESRERYKRLLLPAQEEDRP